MTYIAAISACGKGEQWQVALELFARTLGEGQDQELYCGCAGARYAGKNIETLSLLVSCLFRQKKGYAMIYIVDNLIHHMIGIPLATFKRATVGYTTTKRATAGYLSL